MKCPCGRSAPRRNRSVMPNRDTPPGSITRAGAKGYVVTATGVMAAVCGSGAGQKGEVGVPRGAVGLWQETLESCESGEDALAATVYVPVLCWFISARRRCFQPRHGMPHVQPRSGRYLPNNQQAMPVDGAGVRRRRAQVAASARVGSVCVRHAGVGKCPALCCE